MIMCNPSDGCCTNLKVPDLGEIGFVPTRESCQELDGCSFKVSTHNHQHSVYGFNSHLACGTSSQPFYVLGSMPTCGGSMHR